MSDNRFPYNRRSIRLVDYDYSQEGAYFVTICVYQRETIFEKGRFRGIVEKYWFDLSRHYPHAELDEFVVMPNHIHGIILLVGAGLSERTGPPVRSDKPALARPPRAGLSGLRPDEPAPTNTIQTAKRHSLSEVIRFFKTYSAREINRVRRTPGLPVWQRNYYEHIVRNEESLSSIREYIINNPLKWQLDIENSGIWTDPAKRASILKAEEEFWGSLKNAEFDKSNPYKDRVP